MSAIITDPTYPLTNIADPGVNDVMCGRGGGTNNHIGNRRFRMLVNEHKMRYLAATKLDKPKVAREVMIIWRKQDPPGRFLSKDAKTKLWHDVGDQKAREKASQCLRERRTPSDVLPFLMPGKKKKLQAEIQAGQVPAANGEGDDGGAVSEGDEEGESSERDPADHQPPAAVPEAKRRTLPRLEQMQQIEKIQQLEKMQQEMKLQEMKLLLQQQQQQQQHQDMINQAARKQRIFPRQLARSQTVPGQVVAAGGNADHPDAMAQNVPSHSGMAASMAHIHGGQSPPNLSSMGPPRSLSRQMTAPISGWEDAMNGNGQNYGGHHPGDKHAQQYHATTAAAAAFRVDLTQKYGLAVAAQAHLHSQGGPLEEVGSSAHANSVYSSMRSLEFEDLKEWADISSRSLGLSSKSLGVSARSLNVDNKSRGDGSSAVGRDDGLEYDDMDWMKSFKSLASSKDNTASASRTGTSPNTSLRRIMNAVDENNAFDGMIQPIGFGGMDEQSQQSWTKSMRRAKMQSARKLQGTSSTSMMSELTDLSADLVALDLASVDS